MPKSPITVEARFARITKTLSTTPGVTLGTGRRGFGTDALCVHGRIFAMVSKGQLVVKLPRERVDELCGSGAGSAFDAGKGRPMREWVALSERYSQHWLKLTREALAFVETRPAAARHPRRR